MASQPQHESGMPADGTGPKSDSWHNLVQMDKGGEAGKGGLAEGAAGFIPPPVDRVLSPYKESVDKITGQAKEAFEKGSSEMGKIYKQHLEPNLGPVFQVISKKHAEYPWAIEVTASLLAVIYGGALPRLVLLYVVTKNIETVSSVWGRAGNIWTDFSMAQGGIRDKLVAVGASQKPTDISLLIVDAGLQFCYFLSVIKIPMCAAPVVATAIYDKLQLLSSPHVVAALKRLPQFEGPLGEKWAPFVSRWGHILILSIVCWVFRSIAAAMVIGIEGGCRMIEMYSEGRKTSMDAVTIARIGAAIALVGSLFQMLYLFSLGSSWLFLPFRLLLIPARILNAALYF